MKDQNSDADLAGLLRAVDAFADLPDAMLDEILAQTEVRTVPMGAALITEGDEADCLYLTLSGRFTVIAGETAIAEIGPGEPVGELAFFAGGRRTAHVVAARDSSALMLTRPNYDALSARMPALVNGLLGALSRRLADKVAITPGLRPTAGKVCALLPGANRRLPMALVAGLRAAFEGLPGWVLVSSEDRPASVRGDTEATGRWLHSLEQTHETLVLICTDPETEPAWRHAVMRNSDSIFLAVPKSAYFNPLDGPSALENQVYQAKMKSNVQLVLYRDTAEDSRAQTRRWLAGRDVGLHHHVALDQPGDLARLARFMRGEAVGLVMCGGGSFGTAHLGAIKYLQDQGFAFDLVGGTSVGAAMAGALAMGLGPEHVMAQCEDIFLRSRAMSRYTLPRHGLLDHHTLDQAFLQHYGTQDIEDLPVNFYAVATSLTYNDVSIQRAGPLRRAIRASTAIPGIFPPMILEDGEVLIDGSLIDNVPVDAMRALKPGPNIILNFAPDKAWRTSGRYEDLPTRAQTLRSLLQVGGGQCAHLPTAFGILQRAMVVNARRLLGEIQLGDDVLLNLSVLPGMSFMDWKRGRDLFDAAYRQMETAMARASDHAPNQVSDQAPDLPKVADLAALRAAAPHIAAVASEMGLTTR